MRPPFRLAAWPKMPFLAFPVKSVPGPSSRPRRAVGVGTSSPSDSFEPAWVGYVDSEQPTADKLVRASTQAAKVPTCLQYVLT